MLYHCRKDKGNSRKFEEYAKTIATGSCSVGQYNFNLHIQVFPINFALFAVEFVTFAIEFSPFVIGFVGFAVEFVGFAIELVTFAQEFITTTLAAINQSLITRYIIFTMKNTMHLRH